MQMEPGGSEVQEEAATSSVLYGTVMREVYALVGAARQPGVPRTLECASSGQRLLSGEEVH